MPGPCHHPRSEFAPIVRAGTHAGALALLAVLLPAPTEAVEPLFGPIAPRPDGPLPLVVNLQPMLQNDDADNDVDRWLLDIARSDGKPEELDAPDFLRAVPVATVEAFLAAAARYVNARWIRGDRTPAPVTAFLDDISRLTLPPKYTVFVLYGHGDIGRLRRGHFFGRAQLGWRGASGTIQGHDVGWDLAARSLGAEVLWPWHADPYQSKWPLVYLGLAVDAADARGTLDDAKGTPVADVTHFAVGMNLTAHARLTLSPSVLVHAGGGAGFAMGTLKVARRPVEGGLKDPCEYDRSRGIDLGAATRAVRCTVTTSFGFFQEYPLIATAGVQLWGWLDLDVLYQTGEPVVDAVQVAPKRMHALGVRVGVALY